MPAEAPRLTRPAGPRPGVGIVHLGLGAFFRAHGAIYIAEAMQKSGGDWGIVGVSLVRPDQRDPLAPQGFAYTALELGPRRRDPAGRRRRSRTSSSPAKTPTPSSPRWPTPPSASSA